MRFHSAMATLEPQKYVIAGTVGTEIILLVSGRLVDKQLTRKLVVDKTSIIEKDLSTFKRSLW